MLGTLLILSTKLLNVTAHPTYELADSTSLPARRFGSAYSRLKTKGGFCALNFFTWFLMRRALVVLLILTLQDWPRTQISLHGLLAFMDFCILVSTRPFVLRVDLAFNILNSIFLLVLYGFVLALYLY